MAGAGLEVSCQRQSTRPATIQDRQRISGTSSARAAKVLIYGAISLTRIAPKAKAAGKTTAK